MQRSLKKICAILLCGFVFALCTGCARHNGNTAREAGGEVTMAALETGNRSAYSADVHREKMQSIVPIADYRSGSEMLQMPSSGRFTQDRTMCVMTTLTALIVVIIWAGIASYRTTRTDLKKAVEGMSAALALWLGLRLFCYQLVPKGWLYTICGSVCYVFHLLLPLIFLYIAAVIDRPGGKDRMPGWAWCLALPCLPLTLMLFSNHLHHWMFYPADGKAYGKGPGYFLFYGYGLLLFLIALLVMMKKNWHRAQRKDWLVPVLPSALLVLYTTSYALGLPRVRESNYILICCILTLLIFECLVHTGFAPANTRYDLLFQASPLDMQLLDEHGRTVLAGDQAQPLDQKVCAGLCAQAEACVQQDKNTILHGHRIHNGTVVWREDVTAFNLLQQQLHEAMQQLEAANSLLVREAQVQHQKNTADAHAQLFAALENEVREKTGELAQMIRDLPRCSDRSQQIAVITLLLCYIKRRCNLFFLAKETREMAGRELRMYLDELSEFAGYARVHALMCSSCEESWELHRAVLCYDFYFAVIFWSAQHHQVTLLGQLEQKSNGREVRILAANELGMPAFSSAFCAAVEAAGGTLRSRPVEDMIGLYLEFPKGGADE